MAGFPKAGDEYGGRYRIVREIGHGGMGIVYEAVDRILNRSVALKIVLPSLPDRDDFQARFAREAAVLAKIKSRNIVGIYEYGEHEDTVFFVTELFPDGDLQTWLVKNGPLDRRASLALLAQVCEALADAHAVGVIHRDVKPGNVLLWSRPEGLIPYLCDFGIAIEGTGDGSPRASLTRTGTLVGSPAYMAPERHFGHAADERGDIYSMGCLLWSILTGDAPYSGTDFQMMNAHINAPVPRLGTGHVVDDRIDQVLAQALNKDPELRTPSAGALRAELLAIIRDIDSQAVPAPLPTGGVTAAEPFDNRSDAKTRTSNQLAGAAAARAAAPQSAHDSSAHHTVIRSGAVGRTPPPSAPTPAKGSPSRRWLPAALVAALVAVAIGTTAFLVNAYQGDGEPVAGDSPTPSVSESPSTSLAALVTPGAPKVTARPGYRSVVFRTLAPRSPEDVRQRVEVNAGNGWREARRMTITTEQGGDRGCIQARTVAYDDTGREEPGDPVRSCGRAQPRTAALVRVPGACSDFQNGITYPCQWYGLRLAGFSDGATPTALVRQEGATQPCTTASCERRVTISDGGRTFLPHYFKILTDSGFYVLDVDGVTSRVHLYR
jgi:serine/threonine protein kinase